MGVRHLPGLVLLLAAAAAGQSPLLLLELRDPGSELLAASRSTSVRALFDSVPMRQAMEGQIGSSLARLRAGLELFAARAPQRVRIAVPGSTGEALGSLMVCGIAVEALASSLELSQAKQVEGRALLRSVFPESIRGLAGLALAVELEWERERVAEGVFESISGMLASGTAGLSPSIATLFEVATTDDRIAVRSDLAAFLASPTGAKILLGLGVLEGEEDAFLDEVLAASRDVALELSVALDGKRITCTIGPRGDPPAIPTIDREGDPILCVAWSLDGLRSSYTRCSAFVAELRRTQLPKEIAELEESLAGFERAALLVQNEAQSGRASLAATSEGLRLTTDVARDEPVQPLGGIGPSALVPDDVEFWYATTESNLRDAMTRVLESMIGQATNRANLAELTASDAASTERDAYAILLRECLDLQGGLAELGGEFEPGWAIVASAAGALDSPRGPIAAPAWAIIARPVSDNVGLGLARYLFEQFAEPLGAELEFGERAIRLRAQSEVFGPDASPHAFMHGDLVVLSTSERLSARIRAKADAPTARSGRTSSFETSGSRLGELCVRTAGALEWLLGRQDPEISRTGELLAEALGLFGAIHSDTTLRGTTLHSETVLNFVESERRDSDALIERIRERLGMASLPADRMLVAKGAGTYLGQPATFEFTFGPRGEFRLVEVAERGLDVTWNGTVLNADFGAGAMRLDGIGGGPLRTWAAGVSGQWCIPAIGFEPWVGERTREAITLHFRTDDDSLDRRIRIDADSLLPRCFLDSAMQPLSDRFPTRLSDYREVDGRMLPYRIVSPEGDDHVDSWETVPFDPEVFVGDRAPRFRFEPDAEPMVFEIVDGWILARGRVAGHEGRIAVAPLREAAWVHESVGGERLVSDDGTVELEDVRIGPLRAERFRFVVTRLPKLGDEQVLAMLGTEALQGCCVRVRLRDFRVEVLAPGSFADDGFWPMSGVEGHRIFSCQLRGAVTSWWAPMMDQSRRALLKPFPLREFAALSRTGDGPLTADLQLAWVQLAGLRVAPEFTVHVPIADAADSTPIALGSALIDELTLEMDFPNGSYRLVR